MLPHRPKRTARPLAASPLALLLLAGVALAATQVPRDGFLRERRTRDPFAAAKDAAEGLAPPPLPQGTWIGSDAAPDLAGDRGDVVVVTLVDLHDAASRQALHDLAVLEHEIGPLGLHVVGIQIAAMKPEAVRSVLAEESVAFPVGLDADGAAAKAWMVDDTPDSWVIDRHGVVRVADAADHDVERITRRLVAEPRPDTGQEQHVASVEERARTLAASWPEATYALRVNGERLGTYVQRNRIEHVGAGADAHDQLVLEDEMRVVYGAARVETKKRTVLALGGGGARLVSTECTRTTSQAPATTVALRIDGRKVVGPDGEHVAPADLLPDTVLLRIGALLPATAEAGIDFTFLDTESGVLRDGAHAVDDGPSAQEVLGEQRLTRHWTITGTGRRGPEEVWAGPEGQLLHKRIDVTLEIALEHAPPSAKDGAKGGAKDDAAGGAKQGAPVKHG